MNFIKYIYQYFSLSEDNGLVNKFRNNIYLDISKKRNVVKIDLLPLYFRRGESLARVLYSFIRFRIIVVFLLWFYNVILSIVNIIKLCIPLFVFNKNWSWGLSNLDSAKVLYFGRTNENSFDSILKDNIAFLELKKINSRKIPDYENLLRFLYLRFSFPSISNSDLIKYITLEKKIKSLLTKNIYKEVFVYEGFSVFQRLLLRLANEKGIKTSVGLKNLNYRIYPYYPISNTVYLIDEKAKYFILPSSSLEIKILKKANKYYKNTFGQSLELLFIPALHVYGCKSQRELFVKWLNSFKNIVNINLNIRFHPQVSGIDQQLILNFFNTKCNDSVFLKIDDLKLKDSIINNNYVISEYYSTVLEDSSFLGRKSICLCTNLDDFSWVKNFNNNLILFLDTNNSNCQNTFLSYEKFKQEIISNLEL